MKQNFLLKIFFSMFFILLTSTAYSTTKIAYLTDTYGIGGIHYQCNYGGELKMTGKDGSFTFDNTCTEITFSLNNKVILGKKSVAYIPSDYRLFLTDLAGKERNNTNNIYVKNLASLLQSLDNDRDDSERATLQNGLEINSTLIDLNIPSLEYVTRNTLQSILSKQYPQRDLVSETCALVHLEETLREVAGVNVDTVPPCKPSLALDINATSNDKSYIELIGEKNSKIYLNGIDTNLTLDSDGRYYDFELNTPIKRGTFDDFNITFVDNVKKVSERLSLHIFNDTDQPLFTNLPSNNTFTLTLPNKTVNIVVTDDSVTFGDLTLDFEVLGTDKDFFTIDTTGKLTFIGSTKRSYSIQIKVKDKANHYDIKDIIVNVN